MYVSKSTTGGKLPFALTVETNSEASFFVITPRQIP